MKISKTSLFYQNEVILWRGRGALFWASALLPCCCYALLTVSNFSITNPYTWIVGILSSLVSPVKWLYLSCTCVIYWMMMSNRIKFFSVIPEVRTSKWDAIHSIIEPKRLFHILFHTFGYGVICWFLLQIIGGRYQSFVKFCVEESDESCLNEHHVFIILHAIFLGLVGGVVFFISNQNLIHYPVIEQSKWGQSRTDIATLLIISARFVLNQLKYYYIVYYLLIGAIFKRWLAVYLTISIDPSERVDSVFGLMDLHLFLTSWITGTLIYFFSSMFTVMYIAYETQPYEFVIQSNLEEDENRKLADALACDSVPLLQFQGYQDLCMLAKHSMRRRHELFCLSALGGHPHNWLSISSECLSSLTKFCEDVKSDNTKTIANGSVRQLSGDCSGKDSNTTYRSNDHSIQHLKTESVNVNNNKTFESEPTKDTVKQNTKLNGHTAVTNAGLQQPENTSRSLLAQAQKYIWNIEALSYIVTASYKEDKFGVVQKSLPEILIIFITLQEEVEKMMKLASTMTRAGVENDTENALHTRLRVTLKSAIYNVCSVFGEHVENFNIPQEVKRRLCQYTEYKV